MPPKPFSLQSVLKFRKRKEDLAQDQFLRARLAVDQARNNLEAAKNEIHSLSTSLEEKQVTGILVDDLARCEERIQYKQSHIKQLKDTLARKEILAQKKRMHLLEKAQEHKSLTMLKDQQDATWKEFLDKKEAAMLDEIAILRHDRNIN